MSDDLISRQAAIEALRTCYDTHTLYDGNNGDDYILYDEAVGEIENLPSIQPKTGQWKEILSHRDDEGDILRDYECTNCLGIICDVPDDDEKELPRFCCMCGAKMEGGTE